MVCILLYNRCVIESTAFYCLGAGFIGSHLIDHLLQRNLGRVILLDNFNDYYSPVIKQRNVALLEEKYPLRVLDGSFIIVRGSINDEELLTMIFTKYKVTHIAHLAVSDRQRSTDGQRCRIFSLRRH